MSGLKGGTKAATAGFGLTPNFFQGLNNGANPFGVGRGGFGGFGGIGGLGGLFGNRGGGSGIPWGSLFRIGFGMIAKLVPLFGSSR